MEESVLCALLSNQILDVVNNQSVYALIEIDEFIDFTSGNGSSVLALK